MSGRSYSRCSAMPGNDIPALHNSRHPLWPFRLYDWTLIYFLSGWPIRAKALISITVWNGVNSKMWLCNALTPAQTVHAHAQVCTCRNRFKATGWHGRIRHGLPCVKWTKWTYVPPLQRVLCFSLLKPNMRWKSLSCKQKRFCSLLWDHTWVCYDIYIMFVFVVFLF